MRLHTFNRTPEEGEMEITLRIAWFPTVVQNNKTKVKSLIWLEHYWEVEKFIQFHRSSLFYTVPVLGWWTVARFDTKDMSSRKDIEEQFEDFQKQPKDTDDDINR